MDHFKRSCEIGDGSEFNPSPWNRSLQISTGPKPRLSSMLAGYRINASGLAKLLGVHASMGSKILNGDPALTVGHVRLLASTFKVRPDTFLD